ncbi:MAG: DUF4159 domain-containing protein [Deltaproteobacteria bacterium]|nr:DUF4159 domain-containing protein [Deltaproteobacteria bacterium]
MFFLRSPSASSSAASSSNGAGQRSSRRELLWKLPLLAAGSFSSGAVAFGKSSEVSIATIDHGEHALHRPTALRRLMWDAKKRTALHTARESEVLHFKSNSLFRYPLLCWTGQGKFTPLSQEERRQLARYLRYGGMLWIDAPSSQDPFVQQSIEEVEKALAQRFKALPKDHVLFKSFYLLDKAYGRTEDRYDGGPTGVRALELSKRVAAVVTTCDSLGAFARDAFGTWSFECHPNNRQQREKAFRFGVNMLMYATCLDYKADQVHIPFILKKRRRR